MNQIGANSKLVYVYSLLSIVCTLKERMYCTVLSMHIHFRSAPFFVSWQLRGRKIPPLFWFRDKKKRGVAPRPLKSYPYSQNVDEITANQKYTHSTNEKSGIDSNLTKTQGKFDEINATVLSETDGYKNNPKNKKFTGRKVL